MLLKSEQNRARAYRFILKSLSLSPVLSQPVIGGPIIDDEPLKSVRRPKAVVRLSMPHKSTSTMLVSEMYAAAKKIELAYW